MPLAQCSSTVSLDQGHRSQGGLRHHAVQSKNTKKGHRLFEASGGLSVYRSGKLIAQFAVTIYRRCLLGNFYRFDNDRIDGYVRMA